MGFTAMDFTMAASTNPPLLRPKNTSAPFMASAKSAYALEVAYFCLLASKPSRPAWMCPRLSKTAAFSRFMPSCS